MLENVSEIRESSVVLNKNNTLARFYNVGDTLILHKQDGVNLSKSMEFIIGGFIDGAWGDQFIVVYFNETDYQKIMSEYDGYNMVRISLKESADYTSFINAFRQQFNDSARYSIINYRGDFEVTNRISIGAPRTRDGVR